MSAPIKGLLEKKLIRIMGRKDAPGKPIIYGTTKKFLEVFNLRELADLPTMRELTEITEQQGMLDLETAEEDGGGQETNPRESFEDQISREISDEISEDDTNS